MTNINTSYKATTADTGYDVPQGPDMTELQEKIQDALCQIEGFEYLDYLTEEQLAELNRIKLMLKAESAAISGYALTGEFSLPGAEGAGYWDQPTELAPEWNGILPENIHTDASDGGEGAYGAGLIDDPSVEFAGTVVIIDSGNVLSPTKIGFQMTDDMLSLTSVSKGRDIVVTVEYQDGTKRAWVIKDGTIRREPIIISAFGLSHGVTIDCSHTIRVSDGTFDNYPYGARSGFYIHGSMFNDTIYGTQGDDGIVAYDGDDIIDGMAGNDTIYGDMSYEAAGQFDETASGNDHIKGGAGYDLIYGGGGEDTTYTSDTGEAVTEKEHVANDVASTFPPADDWFSSEYDTWVVQNDMQDGMVVIENTGEGEAGSMQITMPPGYNMAYAEEDGDQNLIITFVGEAGTMKVKIVDFFNEQWQDADDSVASHVLNLEIVGSAEDDIIDFSRVKLTSQTISMKGLAGDDILLNARYEMLSNGLNVNELLSSQNNNAGALNGYENDGIFDETSEEQYIAEVVDGQIVITENPAYDPGLTLIPIGDEDWVPPAGALGIVAPEGYETGYITQDEDGNIYVILVDTLGDASSIVFKIDAATVAAKNLSYGSISVYTKNAEGDDTQNPVGLTAISFDALDYNIDGNEGADFIMTQKGGSYAPDASDSVAEGEFDWDDINAYSYTESELGSEAPATETDDPEDDPAPLAGDTNDDGFWSETEWRAQEGAGLTDDEWATYMEDNTNPHADPDEE